MCTSLHSWGYLLELLGYSDCITISYLLISNLVTFEAISMVLRDSFSVHLDLQSSDQIQLSNKKFHQRPPSQHLYIVCITLTGIWSNDSSSPSINKYLFSTLTSDAKLFVNLMISYWRREEVFLSLLAFLWQTVYLCNTPAGSRVYVKWPTGCH